MDLQPVGYLCPVSRIFGFNQPFQQCLIFLLKLAWSSRFRLPVLITVGFMILDIRMQLEINVDIAVRHQHLEGLEDDEEDDDSDEDDEEEEDEGSSSDNSSTDEERNEKEKTTQ